jgi:hypothetical protein
MSRRLKQAALVFLIIFAAAQFVRPNRTNPPTDESRTIHERDSTETGLVAVLDRSCGDCHSNRTEWRWYARIAPVSWLMARGVKEGRNAVNFSEWAAYSPELQRQLLAASCQQVSAGQMPGPYTKVRPETRLSANDIAIICAAARR